MPGVKGRSGGGGRKSLARHIAEGTYRKDRHGPIPAELLKVQRKGAEDRETPTVLDLNALTLSDEERIMLDKVTQALEFVPAHMGLPLLILVQNLTLYAQAHADVLAAGLYAVSRTGTDISPQMKVRDQLLRQLRSDFAAFALSMSERAALLDLASRASKPSCKPQPGKAMK
ncbi:MAG: hypothetical protein HPZ91_19175 [Lentisphaeria bacterium]|nr:hypothetical protein [Lentisphaeria bacterium]